MAYLDISTQLFCYWRIHDSNEDLRLLINGYREPKGLYATINKALKKVEISQELKTQLGVPSGNNYIDQDNFGRICHRALGSLLFKPYSSGDDAYAMDLLSKRTAEICLKRNIKHRRDQEPIEGIEEFVKTLIPMYYEHVKKY